MLHRDIGMFRVTAAGLCPGEFVTFHCVLNVCSFEAFVAMSVMFQERHEFQSDKETQLLRAGSWKETLQGFGVFWFSFLFKICFVLPHLTVLVSVFFNSDSRDPIFGSF